MPAQTRSSNAKSVAEGHKNSSVAGQPITLSALLVLLLETLDRKDVFDIECVCKLRLISKEIKSYVDRILPFVSLDLDADDVLDLPLNDCLTENIKCISVASPVYEKSARALVRPYLPKLEELSIPCSDDLVNLIIPCTECGIRFWQNLTCLKLLDDDNPLKTFSTLAEVPLDRLKSFRYSSFSGSIEEGQVPAIEAEVATVFSKLQRLTKLDLEIQFEYSESITWDMFKKDSLPNLEDLSLAVDSRYYVGCDPIPGPVMAKTETIYSQSFRI